MVVLGDLNADVTAADYTPPPASGGDVVASGTWNLASWEAFTGAGGASGPTSILQAESLQIEGADVEVVSSDGGPDLTSSFSMTQCGGVIVASPTCGGGTGPSYLEVLSASTASLVLYDGTVARAYSASGSSPDGGQIAQGGAICTTDPIACGGLPNDDFDGSAPRPRIPARCPPPAAGRTSRWPTSSLRPE